MSAKIKEVEALVLHSSGDTDGVRRSLAEAKQLIDEKFLGSLWWQTGSDWHDWRTAQLVCREAAAQLESKTESL